MTIKIILVDDHQILLNGLRSIVEKRTDFKIIGEALNGRDAIKLCEKLSPDVVVMDVAMSGLNGVEATSQIVSNNPNIKVIALSMHSNKQFVIGMFKAGASGYLLKDSDSNELLSAIAAVNRNEKYVSQKISNVLIDNLGDSNASNENDNLTSREKEVLQLLAEGKSSKEIAEILFLSSKTVDVHRNNMMNKLNLHTIPELTKYAIKTGLSSLDD